MGWGTLELPPCSPDLNPCDYNLISRPKQTLQGEQSADGEDVLTVARRLVAWIIAFGGGQLKCDGTRAEARFRLSAKRTSPFKSAGASVQSTTGSRVVRISGSNAGYTMFQGSVKGTGFPLHPPVSPSLPLPCGTLCHLISTGV